MGYCFSGAVGFCRQLDLCDAGIYPYMCVRVCVRVSITIRIHTITTKQREGGLRSSCLGFKPDSAAHQLCVLGQVTSLSCWALASSVQTFYKVPSRSFVDSSSTMSLKPLFKNSLYINRMNFLRVKDMCWMFHWISWILNLLVCKGEWKVEEICVVKFWGLQKSLLMYPGLSSIIILVTSG